ncbi:MAG: excinuclease ABC subunit UvrB [Acholeplasmatales bacterium]|nr:excinuclease ABC subunit UvrB [Acholeplasmatales bacterium]
MFDLKSNFKPTGDQPEAIKQIVDNLNNGVKEQVLMGVTGSGKTFTMANVIKSVNKPTLVLAHNKTLAGQLYSEFKEFFPNDRVEYFISYYDYFQPEAYVVSSDTYIEKDASINDEIDEMRHGATESLLEHRNTIVVASVSCIYGIGDPEDYKASMLVLRVGQKINKKDILNRLIDMQYKRNDIDFTRSTFRVRGDIIDIIPPNEHSNGIKIELFDDEIESIKNFDVLTGKSILKKDIAVLFPATHFMTNKEKMEETLRRIEAELEERIKYFKDNDKLLEAQRIEQRTKYDIEMLREMGSCSGVENYARHLALRGPGETPSTLMDFFPKDFLLIVDESHVTLPQVRGMFNGDRSRKQTLVDYGFRLPSALDNRPLRIEEFMSKINQVLYVSATPGDYELSHNFPITEQIIRPTGLLDPVIEVREELGQIDDLINEIELRKMAKERVLITTLTIKMSEDLTAYLRKRGYKVAYLHSEIKSLERIQIIRDLRIGTYDCLVGINLLREGLDIPEVSLVVILDADKQGFLRSARSLVQTIGRAARNANGKVIMYANTISESMEYAIKETNRRRSIQEKYNTEHNIIPKTIIKEVPNVITIKKKLEEDPKMQIKDLEKEMYEAAKQLDFERAAKLRDIILELKAKKAGKSL